jgi:hypothetical protein
VIVKEDEEVEVEQKLKMVEFLHEELLVDVALLMPLEIKDSVSGFEICETLKRS